MLVDFGCEDRCDAFAMRGADGVSPRRSLCRSGEPRDFAQIS